MKVLVVGSGAREHALASRIAASPQQPTVYCAPGNAGTRSVAESVPVSVGDPGAVVQAARELAVDLAVVGPEAPLVAGLADQLEAAGVLVFGPRRAAAQLEGSKVFAKRFMTRHGIPTADHRVFEDPDAAEAYVRAQRRPLVVKADGLAAGKGVMVTSGVAGALEAVDRLMRRREFGDAGARVCIEERLVGQEVSYHVVIAGERFVPLAAAQDHKRLLAGDEGPNTGGMGAYSPPPVVTPEVQRAILERVVQPTLRGLRDEGLPYRGALFIGLMVSEGQPYVIEYNVRFGDPEAQVLMARHEGDVLPLLLGAARGELSGVEARWEAPSALCVVLASEGYPGAYPKGRVVRGLERAAALPNVLIHHAGTSLRDGEVVTSGGRVLSVTGLGADVDQAAGAAYGAIREISFDGMQYRADIGHHARAS